MLKYKANIANQRHRKPPLEQHSTDETMQSAAFEFFNIEEFLDDNFDKSRKEFLLNTACQMREKEDLIVMPRKGIGTQCHRLCKRETLL